MTKTRLVSLLLTVATALSGAPAFANIITFDFNQPGVFGSTSFTNTTSQGFTFSPSCHIDWGPGVGDSSIGFDTAFCVGQTRNQNYLGPINQLRQ